MRVLRNTISSCLGIVLLTSVMSSNALAEDDEDSPKTTTKARATTSTSTSTSTSTTKMVTPKVTAAPNCMKPTLDAAGEGRRAYMRLNCYSCHSMGAHGGTMGPSLIGKADEVTDAVPDGAEGGMPPFRNYLCANDLANLKAYLQLLDTGSEPTFTDWWVDKPLR